MSHRFMPKPARRRHVATCEPRTVLANPIIEIIQLKEQLTGGNYAVDAVSIKPVVNKANGAVGQTYLRSKVTAKKQLLNQQGDRLKMCQSLKKLYQ